MILIIIKFIIFNSRKIKYDTNNVFLIIKQILIEVIIYNSDWINCYRNYFFNSNQINYDTVS